MEQVMSIFYDRFANGSDDVYEVSRHAGQHLSGTNSEIGGEHTSSSPESPKGIPEDLASSLELGQGTGQSYSEHIVRCLSSALETVPDLASTLGKSAHRHVWSNSTIENVACPQPVRRHILHESPENSIKHSEGGSYSPPAYPRSWSSQSPGLAKVRNHQDLLQVPKDTLVDITFGCPGTERTAYVVYLDLFQANVDFLMKPRSEQWVHCDSQPEDAGKVQRQPCPLLTTLQPIKEIANWLDLPRYVTYSIIQVADWGSEKGCMSRVRRLRSFRSCEEAAVTVFLDGCLQGFSTTFACIVLNVDEIGEKEYDDIRLKCLGRMEMHRDIKVEDTGRKLFVY